MSNKEKYFVLSDGQEPEAIVFSFKDAVESQHMFIDSFDESGKRVESYQRMDSGQYKTEF